MHLAHPSHVSVRWSCSWFHPSNFVPNFDIASAPNETVLTSLFCSRIVGAPKENWPAHSNSVLD